MNKLKREVGSIKSTVTDEMRRKDSALAAANVDAHNAVLELAKMQDKAALASTINESKVSAALTEVDEHRQRVEEELAQAQAELESNRLELERTYAERMAEVDATNAANQKETEEARAQIMEEGRRLEAYMDELAAQEAKQAKEAADTEHAIAALKQHAVTHRAEMAARRKELAAATAAIAERDQALVEADHVRTKKKKEKKKKKKSITSTLKHFRISADLHHLEQPFHLLVVITCLRMSAVYQQLYHADQVHLALPVQQHAMLFCRSC